MKTTFFEILPIILWVGYAWIFIAFICMEGSKRKDAEKEAVQKARDKAHGDFANHG